MRPVGYIIQYSSESEDKNTRVQEPLQSTKEKEMPIVCNNYSNLQSYLPASREVL